jgi:hypothetical protein
MNYAIPPPEVDLASGRAEETIFFTKNSLREFFVKKIDQVPCCRRRRPFSGEYITGLQAHRVPRLIFYRFVVIATEDPENAEVMNGNTEMCRPVPVVPVPAKCRVAGNLV